MSFDFLQIPFLNNIGIDLKATKQLSAMPQGIGDNCFALTRLEAASGGKLFYRLLLLGEQKLSLENKESNNADLLHLSEKDGEKPHNKWLGKISTIDIIEAAFKNPYPTGVEEPRLPSFAKRAACKEGGTKNAFEQVFDISGDSEDVFPLSIGNESKVVGVPLYAAENDGSLFCSSGLKLSENAESPGKIIQLGKEASNDIMLPGEKALNGALLSDTQVNPKQAENEEKAYGGANDYVVSTKAPVSGEKAIDLRDKESYGTSEANLFEKLEFSRKGIWIDREAGRAPIELYTKGVGVLFPKDTKSSLGQILSEHEGYGANIKHESEYKVPDNPADWQADGRHLGAFSKDASAVPVVSGRPYDPGSKIMQSELPNKSTYSESHNLENNESKPDQTNLSFDGQKENLGSPFSSLGEFEFETVGPNKLYDPGSKVMQSELPNKSTYSESHNLENNESKRDQTNLSFDNQEQDFGGSFIIVRDVDFEIGSKGQKAINARESGSNKPGESALRQEESVRELQSSDPIEIFSPSQAEEKEVFHVASDVKRLMETVAKTIDLNKGASSVIKVTIYPEELGEVEVRVTGEKDRLIVKLFAVEEETKDLIEMELGELKDRLLAVGYEVQEISVEGGEEDGSSHRQDLPKGWARSARGYTEVGDSELGLSQAPLTFSNSNISLFA